jgi:phage gp16-like protein
MPLSSKQVSLIHLAKKRLRLDDEEYRMVLWRVAGVESSKQMDQVGFDLFMQYCEGRGFQSDWSQRNFGHRPGMATPQQIALIRRLWSEYTAGQGTDAGLGHWLERTCKVSSVRFLDTGMASKAINGLRAMARRRKNGDGSKPAA